VIFGEKDKGASLEMGVWSLEFGDGSLEMGVWRWEFGDGSLEFGVWSVQ